MIYLCYIDTNMEFVTASLEECMNTGREYKQLIQLFTDQTTFGLSLLEQANSMAIDEPNMKLSWYPLYAYTLNISYVHMYTL